MQGNQKRSDVVQHVILVVVIIREGQTQGRETTFAKIELSSILCFALYLSTESTEGAGELALGGQRNVQFSREGKEVEISTIGALLFALQDATKRISEDKLF